MCGRLWRLVVVLAVLAGVMVVPSAGAVSASELLVEWDASVPVGVDAFVRGVAPEGATGVRVEVLVGVDEWELSDAGVIEVDGGFEVLLSFGADVVGETTFRVVVDTADGEVSSDEFSVARTEPEPDGEPEGDSEPVVEPVVEPLVVDPVTVSAATAGTKLVGLLTYVWGRVDGHVEDEVFTEVFVDGAWVRSESAVSDATGWYVIPLTYGADTAGVYRYRVGAVTPDGTVFSAEFELTRTVPVVTVSAASAGTKQVGLSTYVWGRVSGHTGGEVFTEVWVGGRWSRSQTRTSDATGWYVIPLTYGSGAAGVYSWRVGASAPGGTSYSEPFEFVRTATLTRSSPATSPVGSLATVSGRVGGHSGGQVFTEVLVGGRWSRSQVRTSSSTGYYQIPLTYGASTLGTYTWRVGADTPGGRVYTTSFTITRVPARTLHLSFDDGPNSVYTAQLLSLLAQYDAKATFFPVGVAVNSGASLLRRAAADGHAIGNHTWSHPSLAGISLSRFRSEVLSTQNAIQAATGVRPTCLRPPYGAMDSLTRSRAAALGLSIELWTVDPQDWRRPGANTIASRVINSSRSGSVVVMHDGGGNRSQTVAAVAQILAYFSARGYSFTPMPGC